MRPMDYQAEAPAARKRGKPPTAQALLAAACSIAAAEGLAGLTLRPLAESLAVSVTVLSNHIGARADVITAICKAALAEELRLFTAWRRDLVTLEVLAPAVAADLAEIILEELAVRQRPLSQLFVELAQASTWDETVHAAFTPWLQARRQFWHEFGTRAALPAALLDSGWLAGYFIDELAYSVLLNHAPPYRLLRRLCLRRLFSGLSKRPDESGDTALFSLVFDALEYQAGEPSVIQGADLSAGWPGRAAHACAMQLSARGVSGLTHRAIAAEAGVPHTTLSYRFPTQHDLVIAGLEYIISHLLIAVDQAELSGKQLSSAGDQHGLDVGRATFAVAIAATRLPRLAPCAADMRRRRGINLVKLLPQLAPDASGLDWLAAQIMSIGLIGLANTLPPGETARLAINQAFGSVIDWAQRA
ncbi:MULTISPECIES: TetR family transcriptional regulator [unclassified Janthinobacterium]|uniref:TetR family transcriptional regulator n=1 Tax=unclassified Janthinobacterium TaxID=2610881 RepID=UPI00160F33A4|nr:MULTISPECIES: TetR family transcriptional regulator [unclassified Janthinobacterium]MBB5606747.1 AcrR family transcriptional regulator [Janthinobacterium sp. S3T4]MBB5612203.1 AcrR family transcriptional regulator [Janthinobacterium sp. S3M3]